MRPIVFAPFTLAVACGPQPGSPGPGTTAITSFDTGGTSVVTSVPPSGGPGVAGVLVGPEGPLGFTDLLLCNPTGCIVGSTEADGSYLVSVEPPLTGAFKTHEDVDSDPRKAALIVPVDIPDDQVLELGDTWVPDLPEGVPFGDPDGGPQTLAAGDGLEVTLARSDLQPALGTFLWDIAASRIPDGYVRDYPELPGETVVGVWAIHPFGATCTSPIGIRAPVALAAGTEVWFRSIDDFDGTFSDPATGRSDGTFVTTDPGEGLDRLTWLVITVP